MLRALVLLFALLDAGLYFWLHANPQALQPDREPQRLGHQVSPNAVQVLPDVPASGARGAALTGTLDPAVAAAAQSAMESSPAAGATAVPAALVLPARSGDTALECAETPPLDDSQFNALKAALARAG